MNFSRPNPYPGTVEVPMRTMFEVWLRWYTRGVSKRVTPEIISLAKASAAMEEKLRKRGIEWDALKKSYVKKRPPTRD